MSGRPAREARAPCRGRTASPRRTAPASRAPAGTSLRVRNGPARREPARGARARRPAARAPSASRNRRRTRASSAARSRELGVVGDRRGDRRTRRSPPASPPRRAAPRPPGDVRLTSARCVARFTARRATPGHRGERRLDPADARRAVHAGNAQAHRVDHRRWRRGLAAKGLEGNEAHEGKPPDPWEPREGAGIPGTTYWMPPKLWAREPRS